jgi:hypothetical protein
MPSVIFSTAHIQRKFTTFRGIKTKSAARHMPARRYTALLDDRTDNMKPVKSTAEILAFKVLNRDVDKTWVDWAVDMLMAGFDTEYLTILAGESEPFNQFQMQELVEKVLAELQLDYSDNEQTLKNYACYLIDKSLDGELDNFKVLDILKDICIELDYDKYFYDFYLLYNAKDDLSYSENQWYWDGATRENIEKIITDYFRKWKTNCVTDEKTTTA